MFTSRFLPTGRMVAKKHAFILDKVIFNLQSSLGTLKKRHISPSFSSTLNSLMTFSAAPEITYLIVYLPKWTPGAENISVRWRRRLNGMWNVFFYKAISKFSLVHWLNRTDSWGGKPERHLYIPKTAIQWVPPNSWSFWNRFQKKPQDCLEKFTNLTRTQANPYPRDSPLKQTHKEAPPATPLLGFLQSVEWLLFW